MAKIVAIVNQKGGVGKTTTCVNLTSSLKEKGNRVLLCDFDPQANSTSGMGVDKTTARSVYDVLINGADVTACITHTRYGDVLPSSKALAGAGIDVFDMEPPIPADYPLLHAKNTVLTPHVAFATDESMLRRAEIVFRNVEAYLNGQPENICKL